MPAPLTDAQYAVAKPKAIALHLPEADPHQPVSIHRQIVGKALQLPPIVHSLPKQRPDSQAPFPGEADHRLQRIIEGWLRQHVNWLVHHSLANKP